jgi:hypothetical protein
VVVAELGILGLALVACGGCSSREDPSPSAQPDADPCSQPDALSGDFDGDGREDSAAVADGSALVVCASSAGRLSMSAGSIDVLEVTDIQDDGTDEVLYGDGGVGMTRFRIAVVAEERLATVTFRNTLEQAVPYDGDALVLSRGRTESPPPSGSVQAFGCVWAGEERILVTAEFTASGGVWWGHSNMATDLRVDGAVATIAGDEEHYRYDNPFTDFPGVEVLPHGSGVSLPTDPAQLIDLAATSFVDRYLEPC